MSNKQKESQIRLLSQKYNVKKVKYNVKQTERKSKIQESKINNYDTIIYNKVQYVRIKYNKMH